jgi:hypothetical protein
MSESTYSEITKYTSKHEVEKNCDQCMNGFDSDQCVDGITYDKLLLPVYKPQTDSGQCYNKESLQHWFEDSRTNADDTNYPQYATDPYTRKKIHVHEDLIRELFDADKILKMYGDGQRDAALQLLYRTVATVHKYDFTIIRRFVLSSFINGAEILLQHMLQFVQLFHVVDIMFFYVKGYVNMAEKTFNAMLQYAREWNIPLVGMFKNVTQNTKFAEKYLNQTMQFVQHYFSHDIEDLCEYGMIEEARICFKKMAPFCKHFTMSEMKSLYKWNMMVEMNVYFEATIQNCTTFSEENILELYAMKLYDFSKQLFEQTLRFEKEYNEETCLHFLQTKDKTLHFAALYKNHFLQQLGISE